MRLDMKYSLILLWLTISLNVSGVEPEFSNLAQTISQKHHLETDDLETFNLIAACRYDGTSCSNPLVTTIISSIIDPKFKTATATPLQKATLALISPIIIQFNEAIGPIKHSLLTPSEQETLIALARCLFFKLNCDIKAKFILLETEENFVFLKNIATFKIELDNAYRIALTNGMVMGVPPVKPLDSYRNSYFSDLTKEFSLNASDANLLIRFIRFVNEQNYDQDAENIYTEVMKLITKLLQLKSCLLNPECFKESMRVEFISKEDAEHQYEYNLGITIAKATPLIKAAYNYWESYNIERNKQTESMIYLKAVPDISDLEKRLAALKADLPTKTTITARSPETTTSSASATPTSETESLSPLTVSADLTDNLVQLEQQLYQAGYPYQQVITTNLITKKNWLSSGTLVTDTSLDSDDNHDLPSLPIMAEIVPTTDITSPINKDNLVTLENLLINNFGYSYNELLNLDFITKQSLASAAPVEPTSTFSPTMPSKYADTTAPTVATKLEPGLNPSTLTTILGDKYQLDDAAMSNLYDLLNNEAISPSTISLFRKDTTGRTNLELAKIAGLIYQNRIKHLSPADLARWQHALMI